MRFLILLFFVSINVHAENRAESSLKFAKQKSTAADQLNSRSVGHLVTPNNTLMKKGEIGVGTLYAAYAFTDNFNFGISPFAFLAFNMYNVMGRVAKNVSSRERVGFDFAYFKTFNDSGNYYTGRRTTYSTDRNYYSFKMEAWDTKFTYNNLIKPWYRLNVSGSFYYYINDERPFSLRMDPGKRNEPYAINLTSLHELRMAERLFLNLEAGFWGLNYAYPYYHLGTSISYQTESFLLGLGLSTTFSPSFPAEKARFFAGYDSRQSVHPELQIQGFF